MRNSKKKNQLASTKNRAGLYILLAIILFIINVLYDAEIKPEFRFSVGQILVDLWHNFIALFRYVNFQLYRFMGLTAYLFPLLVFHYSVKKYKKTITAQKSQQLLLHHIFIIFLSIILSTLYGYFSSDFVSHLGGWLGGITIMPLIKSTGVTFTLILAAAFCLSIIWFFDFGIFKSAKRFLQASSLAKLIVKLPVMAGKRILELIIAAYESLVKYIKHTDFKEIPINEVDENTQDTDLPFADIDGSKDAAENQVSHNSSSAFVQSSNDVFAVCDERLKKNFVNKLPDKEILSRPAPVKSPVDKEYIQNAARAIEGKFKEFNVRGKITGHTIGPVIIRFEYRLASGISINDVKRRADDIALLLGQMSLLFQIPIPGKNTIGIEVIRKNRQTVYLGNLFDQLKYPANASKLYIPLGLDVSGQVFSADIVELPHLLIAGTTGSGKSVFLNSLLVSLLLRNNPNDLRLLLFDVKHTELTPFNTLPHLLYPVITDVKIAIEAFSWAASQMEIRFKQLAKMGVRNIGEYNSVPDNPKPMPCIMLVVDEFSDMLIQGGKVLEDLIIRLGQKSRAVGIHLILATQRPSADIIPGLIKDNFPARLSFYLPSHHASRIILDDAGAEKLVGKGDMLFKTAEMAVPIRLHGAILDSVELNKIVKFWSA